MLHKLLEAPERWPICREPYVGHNDPELKLAKGLVEIRFCPASPGTARCPWRVYTILCRTGPACANFEVCSPPDSYKAIIGSYRANELSCFCKQPGFSHLSIKHKLCSTFDLGG